MTTTPWKVAAQSVTVLNPDKEPSFTLVFAVDHAQADVSKLRIVPANADGPACELTFATAGFIIGQPHYQPRWLKAFERPDPNLHIEDDAAWREYRNSLGEDDAKRMQTQRDGFMKRKNDWESRGLDQHVEDEMDRRFGKGDPTEPAPSDEELRHFRETGQTPPVPKNEADVAREHGLAGYNPSPGGVQAPEGADDNSPANPEVQANQAAGAGVEKSDPAPEDQKAMVGLPGGQAPTPPQRVNTTSSVARNTKRE